MRTSERRSHMVGEPGGSRSIRKMKDQSNNHRRRRGVGVNVDEKRSGFAVKRSVRQVNVGQHHDQ